MESVFKKKGNLNFWIGQVILKSVFIILDLIVLLYGILNIKYSINTFAIN